MSQLDLQRVLREIDEEVAARRASGDFPPGMERDLDLIFARFAPASTSSDDLQALIEQADRGAFIDVDPPTGSRIPPLAFVKRVQRKLLSWYFRYVAQQVSVFAAAVVNALKLLGRRVATLEAATPGADPAVRELLLRAAPPVDFAPFLDAIRSHLRGTVGRVLVAECGTASIVRDLRAAGLDAYGCEPRQGLVDSSTASGLDVRSDETLDHLRAVDDAALGGLVLAGDVDRLPVGLQVRLTELASRVLATGGKLALVGTPPAAWGAGASVVDADLSPGRPLHPETWAHLLTEASFGDVGHRDMGSSYLVTATRH